MNLNKLYSRKINSIAQEDSEMKNDDKQNINNLRDKKTKKLILTITKLSTYSKDKKQEKENNFFSLTPNSRTSKNLFLSKNNFIIINNNNIKNNNSTSNEINSIKFKNNKDPEIKDEINKNIMINNNDKNLYVTYDDNSKNKIYDSNDLYNKDNDDIRPIENIKQKKFENKQNDLKIQRPVLNNDISNKIMDENKNFEKNYDLIKNKEKNQKFYEFKNTFNNNNNKISRSLSPIITKINHFETKKAMNLFLKKQNDNSCDKSSISFINDTTDKYFRKESNDSLISNLDHRNKTVISEISLNELKSNINSNLSRTSSIEENIFNPKKFDLDCFNFYPEKFSEDTNIKSIKSCEDYNVLDNFLKKNYTIKDLNTVDINRTHIKTNQNKILKSQKFDAINSFHTPSNTKKINFVNYEVDVKSLENNHETPYFSYLKTDYCEENFNIKNINIYNRENSQFKSNNNINCQELNKNLKNKIQYYSNNIINQKIEPLSNFNLNKIKIDKNYTSTINNFNNGHTNININTNNNYYKSINNNKNHSKTSYETNDNPNNCQRSLSSINVINNKSNNIINKQGKNNFLKKIF